MTRSAIPSIVAVGAWGAAAWPVGAGKTIAYMSVTGAQKSRPFTLRTCKED